MALLRAWLLPALALLCQAEQSDQDCEASKVSLNLLQARAGFAPAEVPRARRPYWPHARGQLGSLSRTTYGPSEEQLAKLNASLAWKWVHPSNLSAFVWGTLIDKDKNIIICSMQGIYKYTPDKTLLWSNSEISHTEMPLLMGNGIYGMEQTTAKMYGLDLETGNFLWLKKIALTTGQEGDFVEGHNGVLVAAVGWASLPTSGGTPALRTIGVNASDGTELWSFTPECGIWNIMALFPDDESTVFMDDCGGLYRLNLHTGREIWRHKGSEHSWTDGGPTLGPDNNIYTCSNGPNTQAIMQDKNSHAGRLRKYSVRDGSLLWETELTNPCLNFPSVSPDGKSVVLADGANVLDPPMKWVHGKSSEVIEKEWALQQALLRNKTQLQHYGRDNLEASILGFDASTGSLKWKHDVEPWYGMSFILDEERAYLWDKGMHPFGHCGPPHWGGVTIDQRGMVYVARSDGKLYILDPATDKTVTFTTGDGALMGGVAFAPGLMVVPTCSWVYVFRF